MASASTMPAQQQLEQPASASHQPPISIDTQHDDMVHDVQLDYYGCKMATCSSDRTVKIFDVNGDQYNHTATLQGHEGPVWEVAWAHPKFGAVLASCSFDSTVLLHRESRPHVWQPLYTHRFHESSVNSVAFAPHEHGLMLACASSDGRVSVLTHQNDDSWTSSVLRDSALGVNAVSWAPYTPTDSTEEFSSLSLVTGGCDNRIRFWTHAQGQSAVGAEWVEETDVLGGTLRHTDWVRDVAWAPGSTTSKMTMVASCSEDGTVIVWTRTSSVEGGEGKWMPSLLHTFDGPVWRLSWSVTGHILAVSSGDDSVTLWKANLDGTWQKVSTVEEVGAGGATSDTH